MYGSILPPGTGTLSAVANYTMDNQSSVANVPQFKDVITDYPLFISKALDPSSQHFLNVDISASAEEPYLLDYLLLYSEVTDLTGTSTQAATSSSTGTRSATTMPSSTSRTAAPRHDMSVILATGSYDHDIRFWEAWSGICSRTIQRKEESGVRTII